MERWTHARNGSDYNRCKKCPSLSESVLSDPLTSHLRHRRSRMRQGHGLQHALDTATKEPIRPQLGHVDVVVFGAIGRRISSVNSA